MSNDPKAPNKSTSEKAVSDLKNLAPKPASLPSLVKEAKPGNPPTQAAVPPAKPNVYVEALQSMKEASRNPKNSPSNDVGDEVTGSFVGIEDILPEMAAPKSPAPQLPPDDALFKGLTESEVIDSAEGMTGSFTGLEDPDANKGPKAPSKDEPTNSESAFDAEGAESFADLFADEKTSSPSAIRAPRPATPVSVKPANIAKPPINTAPPAKSNDLPKPLEKKTEAAPIALPAPPANTAAPAKALPASRVSASALETPALTAAAPADQSVSATRPNDLETKLQDPLIGSVLLHYKVLSKIAEGGMGVVYKAQHVSIQRIAAIKLLKLDYCRDEAMVQRFYQEGRLVNQIRHENIIDIFDFGKLDDGRVFYIMEYLEGETVADRLAARGPMPFSEAYPIIEQAAKALRAVHEKGVIHRDLKPENFWLIQREQGPPLLKILDFGIAKLVGGTPKKITKTGSVMGTPQYMSPEQLNNQQPDVRSDIYSFGVVIHELFAGDTPFGEKSIAQIVKAHLDGDIPPLPATTAALGVPSAMRDIVARCTALNPEDRYPSISDLLQDLSAAAGSRALSPQTLAVVSRKPKKQARPTTSWLAPAAVFGGVVVAGVLLIPKFFGTTQPQVVPIVQSQTQSADEILSLDHGALRDTALSILRRHLTSKDASTRASAAQALGDSQDKESLGRLESLLLDVLEESDVRVGAAKGLGKLGVASSKNSLNTARKEADEHLISAIDAAMLRMGEAGASRKLAGSLRSRKPQIRYEVALALSAGSDERTAISALKSVDTQGFSNGEKLAIVRELARLGDEKAVNSLKASLGADNEAQRLLAAASLARIGSDIGREVLVSSLNAKEDESRIVAATSLLYLGDFAGAELLKGGLSHKDPVIRRLAAQGLQVIADEAFLPALADSLSDQDAQVQITVSTAMLSILGLDPSLLARAGTEWIEKALAEDDTEQKLRALRLAKDLSDKAALAAYKKGISDENEKVQIAAAKGLAVLSRKGTAESGKALELLKETSGEKGVLGVVSRGGLAASGDSAAKADLAKSAVSRDKEIRAAALETAAATGQLDIVETGLKDPDLGLRVNAGKALAEKRNPKGEAALKEGLQSKDPKIRTQAYIGLKALGKEPSGAEVDPALLIASSDPSLRVEAANLAAEGKGSSAIIRKAIYDADPSVRLAGIQAATARKEKNLLRIGLRDPNPAVKAAAEIGLLQLSDKPNAEPAPSNTVNPNTNTPAPDPVSTLGGKDYDKLKAAKVKMASADVALAGGRASEALRLYQEAQKLAEQPDIQWYYAQCYRRMGDNAKTPEEKKKNWTKAKAAYERFASSRKSDARAKQAKDNAANLEQKLASLK
jgi:serine/threonine protein kinase